MSKGLASFPEDRRMAVATRRAANSERGCGYWAAVSFLNKKGIKTPEQKRTEAVSAVIRNADIQSALMRQEDKHPRPLRHFRDRPVSSMSDRNKKTLAAFKG